MTTRGRGVIHGPSFPSKRSKSRTRTPTTKRAARHHHLQSRKCRVASHRLHDGPSLFCLQTRLYCCCCCCCCLFINPTLVIPASCYGGGGGGNAKRPSHQNLCCLLSPSLFPTLAPRRNASVADVCIEMEAFVGRRTKRSKRSSIRLFCLRPATDRAAFPISRLTLVGFLECKLAYHSRCSIPIASLREARGDVRRFRRSHQKTPGAKILTQVLKSLHSTSTAYYLRGTIVIRTCDQHKTYISL